MRREQQIALVLTTAVTWFAMAWILGIPETLFDAARPFLSALTVASVLTFCYDKFAWHWPFFHRNLTHQPNIEGVWKLHLESTWKDENGVGVEPIQGFVQIDQTGSSFSLRMYTRKSNSETLAYSYSFNQKVYSLSIVYENDPNPDEKEEGSPYHKGCAVLKMRGRNPAQITGDYWTERKSTGKLILKEKKRGEIGSFTDGEKLFEQSKS